MSNSRIFQRLEAVEYHQLLLQKHQSETDRKIEEVLTRLDDNMKIENLLNKHLWQMTGKEFIFLSKSATSDNAPRQLKEAVRAFMEFSKSV